MSDSKSGLVKKIGEGNKSLSVIVAEDKLAKFKKFSQGINLSMGYLLNQAIDRYLANNSTEIFNTSTGIPTTIGNNIPPATLKEDNIEKLINTTIETYLSNKPLDNRFSIGIDEVKNLIKTSIDSIEVEASIDAKVVPLAKQLGEIEAYTKNQIEALRDELKKAISDRAVEIPAVAPIQSINRATDPSRRTWGQFFEMVGIAAMTAGEAQKKKNTPLRDRQIAEGIALAQKIGLGVWTATRAGREFTKSDDAPNP